MGAVFGVLALILLLPFIVVGEYSVNSLYDLLYTLTGWTGILPFWKGF